MKNLSKTLIALFLLVSIISVPTFAQKKGKTFRGKITYSMTYSGDGVEPSQLAQLPKESEVKIYDNKTLTEQGPASVITNGDLKTVNTVIDLSSYGMKKYLIVQKQEDIEKENKGTKINYSEDSKDILGYKTKKVEISAPKKEDDEEDEEEGESAKIIAYYTEDLGGEEVNFGSQFFHGVKGVVLEYEVITSKLNIKAIAKSVEKGKVKESDFLIPSDCTETTMEAFQEEMKSLRGEE